jgi:uncharacterized protein YbbC (DUF1343 family)
MDLEAQRMQVKKLKVKQIPKQAYPLFHSMEKIEKPTPLQLKGIDVLVFDLQDVGARFYTYLSTLHYVMEACAENDISLIVLDRPNPNIHYVDGPVLGKKHTSFVGMHPVPIVYGMTIGEYAQMINGEGWLEGAIQCDLKIIPIKNYSRNSSYELLVRPSPNLPNAQAVALYPSLCLLEPTVISVGQRNRSSVSNLRSSFTSQRFFRLYSPAQFWLKESKTKRSIVFR